MDEDGLEGLAYIWAGSKVSPNKDKIAIEGCIWGAPYQIKIYDISKPNEIPYPIIFETSWEDEYLENIGWIDNNKYLYKDEKKKEIEIKI